MAPKFTGGAPLAVLVVAVLVFLAAVAFMIWGNSCSQQPASGPASAVSEASSKSAAIELPEI